MTLYIIKRFNTAETTIINIYLQTIRNRQNIGSKN